MLSSFVRCGRAARETTLAVFDGLDLHNRPLSPPIGKERGRTHPERQFAGFLSNLSGSTEKVGSE
jgi:hypothetical protein